MSEESRPLPLLSNPFPGAHSSPLIIFAYAVVATLIAGFAAPAAGLAVLVLGLMTALSLAFAEWHHGETSDRMKGEPLVGVASFLASPTKISAKADPHAAQPGVRAEQSERASGTVSAPSPQSADETDASKATPRERDSGARSGSPPQAPSSHNPDKPRRRRSERPKAS